MCALPIFCPLDDYSDITSKFIGCYLFNQGHIQPTNHLQQQHVFPRVQQHYLQQQVNTSRPPVTYPTTSGRFHFVNPVMSPATQQPSNTSSSESKKGKKVDILSVIQEKDPREKENENEEKLEWPKDMVLRLLELYKDERFVKKVSEQGHKEKQIWIEIADVLNKEGFKTVTGEQCDAKFRNLKRTYTKVEDNTRMDKSTS